MKSSFKKVLKEKRGFFTIEYVMSLLIFIILFSFVYDLTLIVVQRNRATNVLQSMVRVVQVQSGLEPTVPTYFPTVGNSYLRSETFLNNSKRLLSDLGINPDSVVVSLSGTSIDGSSLDAEVKADSNLQLKYKTPFTVKLTYRYQFTIWSNFVPGLNDCEQTLTSVGYAEYKQNYDEWDGE